MDRGDKAKYNELLSRMKKAEQWFEREDVSDVEKDKHMPTFQAIVAEMERIIQNFMSEGYNISSEVILNGFPEVDKNVQI